MSGSLSSPVNIAFTLKGSPMSTPVELGNGFTQVSTGANTTETDLVSWLLPPGLLDIDGRCVRLTAFGTFGATANNKTLRAYFGSTVFATTGAIAANATNWLIEATVTRTGAATQLWRHRIQHGTTLITLGLGTGAETLANALTLKVTGQNGTAAAGDIVFRGGRIELL